MAENSELSQPSYKLIENHQGQLIGCTSEKVLWPERPRHGKYSLEKNNHGRRRQKQKIPSPVSAEYSSLARSISSSDGTVHITSSFLCGKRQWTPEWKEENSQESSSFSTQSIRRQAEGNTYALLGRSKKDEAVRRLGDRWNVVLFNEKDGKIYLALLHDGKKYVMLIREVQLGCGDGLPGKAWGISLAGQRPTMFFRSLEKMADFYSHSPTAAFYEL